MQLWKLGCRWGKGHGMPLFYDFIKENNIVVGWIDKDYQIGDWLLITDGHTVLSLAKVLTLRKTALDFPQWEDDFESLQLPYESGLSVYEAKFLNLAEKDRFLYPLQQGIVRVRGAEYINTFRKLRTKYMAQEDISLIADLIKYKKQIILQGPPGTGKTKLAMELAAELVNSTDVEKLDWAKIIASLKQGQTIPTVAGNSTYTVRLVENSHIVLSVPDSMDKRISFEKIIEFYNSGKWEEPTINGDDRGAAAIAKLLYDKYIVKSSTEQDDQIKLVQFHPSYSYEDFVRGIVAKPNLEGDGILYEAENKIVGKFAKSAFDNYKLSRNKTESKQIIESKNTFQKFIDHVQEELDKDPDRKYPISEVVYIFDVDDKRFKYKGDNWKAHEKGLNMKFSELEKIIQSEATQRADVKSQGNLEELTRQHATYFFNTIEKYREFEKSNPITINPIEIDQQAREKNFVLIIDEINRANLSSVLGELIYALEYRGKVVQSMYGVDGNNDLILPPNLYIIGTMNTADRSVGHIDYAIRRRFAFVDILPKDLSTELGNNFNKALFDQVAKLFLTNRSNEFELKDVQLGHSYFIDKAVEGGSMAIRLQYEIKPILLEYIKDGILVGEDILEKIDALSA